MADEKEIAYPRQPGSATRIDETNWVENPPFGHCPACGSIGIEELAIVGDPVITFYCSDPTCKDMRGRRTLWAIPKPDRFREREILEQWSWNKEHFPDQNLPEFCPD